jgi:hypothetical protein
MLAPSSLLHETPEKFMTWLTTEYVVRILNYFSKIGGQRERQKTYPRPFLLTCLSCFHHTACGGVRYIGSSLRPKCLVKIEAITPLWVVT